jgi:hypothetical protein
MNRSSYRMLSFVVVFAVMLGLGMSMMPASAEASGMGGQPHPMYWQRHHKSMHTGSAYFKPNELPKIVERDVGDRCQWWRYELRGGRYVRTYCPCRFGDQEVDYSPNPRQLWAQYVGNP